MPARPPPFPRWGCLAYLGLCLVPIAALWTLLPGGTSRTEVARLASPDGSLEAVLIETNGGATTSFGYLIYVVPAGETRSRQEAASLYAAKRSGCAYGVNLRWAAPDRLVAEYYDAKLAEIAEDRPDQRHVSVELRPGINDPNAPCGGMEYNIRAKLRR